MRLNSLIALQLVYMLSPLACKPINRCWTRSDFYKFLWDCKGDKIKRSVMITDYENERLKMLDKLNK